MNIIFPFKSAATSLGDVGGKGANLARLAQAGYPVPDGFLVGTDAYRAFTFANRLDSEVEQVLAGLQADDPQALEEASRQIRLRFAQGAMPPEERSALLDAYRTLGSPPVAVRSSATAEDLPDLSFAGQQDTYLNITDEKALLKAVINCWSSLWTARAIGYRARNHIPHSGVALAVVVQRMVQSDASGVMFTANPLNGLRTQVVIDAAFGLGEALVSGQVEPDHYVVDTQTWQILDHQLGAKALSIRAKAGGGTETVQDGGSRRRALTDAEILALAKLGQQVAGEYGFPQDIEWATQAGQLYLLQSRPITSLFPIPAGMGPQPLEVLFSFGAVQGMLDPLTPLGIDFLRLIFATGARLFGYYDQDQESQPVLHLAGERLWLRITPIFRNSVGRKILQVALTQVEPTVQQALQQLWDEPQLQSQRQGIRLAAIRHLVIFALPMIGRVLHNLARPDARRTMIIRRTENILVETQRRMKQASGSPQQRLAQHLKVYFDVVKLIPPNLALFLSSVIGGMASINLLNRLITDLPGMQPAAEGGWPDLLLTVTRGMPNNPTTEMDLDLWEVAKTIRKDPAALAAFQQRPAAELAAAYLAGELPDAAQQAVRRFLNRYGLRGLGEIDLGRERWCEDPTHVIQVIGSYIQIDNPSLAPDAVFGRGGVAAEAAIDELVEKVRRQPHGWLKARQARFLASRVRAWLGMREAPKFFAVRLMGIVRQAMLASGADFVQAGLLERRDDLLYLYLNELKALSAGERRDWKDLVAARRAAYERELRRRQIPRLFLSNGRAFYEGMASSQNGGDLTGSPVSPGVAEGVVHVVFDPRQAQLAPGEILVCPGTDPSWTPLFLAAGGLVMEVGGMMTHGAVVAREYGIPAVVGVHQATTRLKTGQRIRLDGSTGSIHFLPTDIGQA